MTSNCGCGSNKGCCEEEIDDNVVKESGCGSNGGGCGCGCSGHKAKDDVDHENLEYVELYNEDGVAEKFIIIANFGIDDKDYAILALESNEEEVLIFTIKEENEEFVFETIESEEEIEKVVEAYNELIEEGSDE